MYQSAFPTSGNESFYCSKPSTLLSVNNVLNFDYSHTWVLICTPLMHMMGIPGGSGIKNPPPKQEIQILSLGIRKSPWKRKWPLTPVFLAGKSHGQRSLVDCSPWGSKESDTTERLNNKNADDVKHILKETGIQDHLTCLLRNLCAD